MSQPSELSSEWSSGTASTRTVTVLPDSAEPIEAWVKPRRRGKLFGLPRQRQSEVPAPAEAEAPAAAAPATVSSAAPAQASPPPVPAPSTPSWVSLDAGAHAVAFVDRTTFVRRIETALSAPRPYALVQFGLDNFRHVIAAAGADIGASVLQRFGAALSMGFGGREIAQLGGDTFGVLLPCDEQDEVVSIVKRALTLVASSDLSADGSGVRATASAGITLLDRPEVGAVAALLEADLAMATAKRSGRNRAVVSDTRLGTSITAVHEWAARIRHAIENDGFVLHAQRVRSLREQVDHWELLVRLPLADGELLPPSQFLPVAEQFGLGRAVDEWVTKRALGIVAAETARGAAIRLEVNVGESSLASGDFVQNLQAELSAAGIDPAALIFEVSGTTAEVNADDITVFSAQLRQLGCHFAIDNFGVGAGALDQLRVLPLNYVKIDGSFVRHLADSPADQKIVRALTGLAHELGYQVIAMSVSDDRSVELLQEFGVDYVQGFHIERPYPLEEAR